MQIEKIDYNEVPAISFKDLSYIKKASFLDGFYNYDPDITSFAEAIEARKQKSVDRETLVNNLWQDYREIIPSGIQIDNINALKEEHTFTIITAHQPSLLGGPLYYILKICSTINLCRKLPAAYPEYKFVPIFISGGEDMTLMK